jgi:ferritin-like metal-binding protein YciE
MSVANPRDLLLQQLAELLWIERTLYHEVIPKVHDDAHSPELMQLLTHHRGETREHVRRLEQAFRSLGAEPAAARSASLEATAKQHEDEAKQVTNPELRDVFHCGGVARTEQLELAAYDAALVLADGECADLLERNRKEDEHALDQVRTLMGRMAH